MLRICALTLVFVFSMASFTNAETAFRSSMVKIYTVSNEPDYSNPWDMEGPYSSSGSGVVIKGNRILTNAHVVSNQTYLQVRANGMPDKYDATVTAVSHEADLAVIAVDDPSFFKKIKPLEIGGLPELQEPIVVCGFPTGGDTLSMTTGVVSRIENQRYSHSHLEMLAIQVDAAINYGNSGGPALSEDGSIVGVAMQTYRSAENISYLIPTPVIRHFLTDLEDGRYDGVPSLGIFYQTTGSHALREKLGMADHLTGVLVNRVAPGASADGIIERGDVILSVGGYDVASDATVSFRSMERTDFNYVVQHKQIGENLSVRILRNGNTRDISVPLKNKIGTDNLVSVERDKEPTYFIYGGLVFNPLTINYLECWGRKWFSKAPKGMVSFFQNNWKRPERTEIVVLNKVLPIKANTGYHDIYDVIVESIDGKNVTCMNDVVQFLQRSKSKYLDIETADGMHIVLKRENCQKSREAIRAKYKIDADRSADLVDLGDSLVAASGDSQNL